LIRSPFPAVSGSASCGASGLVSSSSIASRPRRKTRTESALGGLLDEVVHRRADRVGDRRRDERVVGGQSRGELLPGLGRRLAGQDEEAERPQAEDVQQRWGYVRVAELRGDVRAGGQLYVLEEGDRVR
jgi:hypothetical protein